MNSQYRRSRKIELSMRTKDSAAGILFIAPWLIGTVFFFALPFLQVFFYAFNDVKFNIGEITYEFVGWKSFIDVFRNDTSFIRSFFEQIGSILLTSVFILFFSIFVALILKSRFHGRTLVRAIFFLPVIIATGPILDIIYGSDISSFLMSGQRASAMFNASSIQDLLLKMGLPYGITQTFISVLNGIFNLSWKSGIQILLFLAGLQNIPVHLYEAAQMESASKWEMFWRITFPMITPVLLLNSVYTVIDGFTDYRNNIVRNIVAYTQNLKLSYAAALGTVYFLIIFIIILLIYWIINRRTFYMER